MKRYSEYRKMKYLLFSAIFLCLGSGCTKKEFQHSEDEIRLGVSQFTRAAVNTLSDLAGVGDNIGIYGIRTADVSGNVSASEWDGVPVMDNVRTSGIDASSGDIRWEGAYYYPLEADAYVKFCAYHPYTSGDAFSLEKPVSAAPVLHFTLSGEEDIMFANPVVGSRNSPAGGLEFRHALTQLRFRVIDQYGTFSGERIEAIVFTGVNTRGTMNIETGALDAWGSPAELPVPGIDGVAITGTAGTPQEIGSEIMLQPGQPSFNLRVGTSAGIYENVTVRPTSSLNGTPESSFAAERSYLITLTFTQKNNIVMSATVVPWEIAGSGSCIIR